MTPFLQGLLSVRNALTLHLPLTPTGSFARSPPEKGILYGWQKHHPGSVTWGCRWGGWRRTPVLFSWRQAEQEHRIDLRRSRCGGSGSGRLSARLGGPRTTANPFLHSSPPRSPVSLHPSVERLISSPPLPSLLQISRFLGNFFCSGKSVP